MQMPSLQLTPLSTLFFSAGALLAAALLGGCGVSDGTDASITVTVNDFDTGKPIADTLLCIEVGGAYVATPDPAKGNPSWQHAAITDAGGKAELVLPVDTYGFHSFVEGYLYGTNKQDVDDTEFALTINMNSISPDEPVPLVSDVYLTPTTVEPGGVFGVSVNAAAAADNKPLSEEVLVIVPAMGMCAAMNPPSPGNPGKGYPDGVYKKSLRAPTQPGTYDVWVSVTSEHCVTAPLQKLQLLVQ